jgi:pyridoxamine 5'-phosphate oxidase
VATETECPGLGDLPVAFPEAEYSFTITRFHSLPPLSFPKEAYARRDVTLRVERVREGNPVQEGTEKRRDRLMREGMGDADAVGDPLVRFRDWHREWARTRPYDAAAAVLATANAEGRPTARFVDLARTDHGFVFFTGHRSRKALDLAVNPWAQLCFGWLDLGRQVRAAGPVERLDPLACDDHYTRLPRPVQLLAWATDQQAVVSGSGAVRDAVASAAERFAGQEVPRPEEWGGFRLVPESVEFWQDRADHVPDRLRYQLTDSGWSRQWIAP